jgi:beta-lactamase regulating signal transducer with metallopeptidase domain/lysophospholipase L1-like esterase
MISEQILRGLIEMNLAASPAIVVAIILRPMASRVLGAKATYQLWLLVPIAALAICIPARQDLNHTGSAAMEVVSGGPVGSEWASLTTRSVATAATWVAAKRSEVRFITTYGALLVLAVWIAGASVLLVRAIFRSRRLAADPLLGPALIGVLHPRLVLPQDFTTRFNAQEQKLILAHESTHQAAGHTLINALVEFGRCANWPNPLVHVAAFYARADQELSCDAAVMSQFPGARGAYARALLKSQTTLAFAPLGCAWPGRSSRLLRGRMEMLARQLPGRSRSMVGFVFVAALVGGGGYAAWSAQPAEHRPSAPADTVRPQAKPAEAPAGLLTALEVKRHARYITQAAAGNIDIVFVGDSTVDFWRYDNSGKPEWNNHSGGKDEWDRTYAPLHAANFGVEGAHTGSVLWRLQHGELEGMKPKVVVLDPLGIADAANHGIAVPQIIAGNRAIIAEIRERQPQAKILVVALPRGQATNLYREVMKPVDTDLAKLADNKWVYYMDLHDRFLAPDGTVNRAQYADGLGQVLSPQGYTTWARAMNPTLTKLMH